MLRGKYIRVVVHFYDSGLETYKYRKTAIKWYLKVTNHT